MPHNPNGGHNIFADTTFNRRPGGYAIACCSEHLKEKPCRNAECRAPFKPPASSPGTQYCKACRDKGVPKKLAQAESNRKALAKKRRVHVPRV